MLSWSTPVGDDCERSGPGFWAEPANVLSSVAFLLAALMAFRRWRQAGGGDIASLALVILALSVGLGSFAFHAVATLGAAILDVGPIALFICSYLFVVLHRFLRFSPSKAVSFALAFVLLSTFAQRLVPTDIRNGSIGYVPPLAVMCLIAALALRREGAAFAAHAAAPTGLAPPGEGERARRLGCC